MTTRGFDAILRQLDQLEQEIIAAAVRGLEAGAAELEADAQATGKYRDDTGATRAGTVAFVATAQDDGGAQVSAARAAVEAKNPGRSHLEPVGDVGDTEIKVVLTVPTDYQEELETRKSGEHAFVGPTLEQHAPRLTAAAARAIAEVLR